VTAAAVEPDRIRRGTAEFRRTNLALFTGSFATFALLYCVQPLMPVFAQDFRVSAAQSSLVLSLTTLLLAPSMIVAGAISESRGRKPIMVASLLASALLTFASAFVTRWHVMLVLRALAGITFAGLPATSMAYLAEEIHPGSIGFAMGLSIGGNGLGGMLGRLVTSLLTSAVSWRFAVAIVGLLGVASALLFWRALPPSRCFTPRHVERAALARSFAAQLRRPRLVALFAEGFLLMGTFGTSYNYITYHLLAAPYRLSEAGVGMIFSVYLVGIASSAWIGALADRLRRDRMLIVMLAAMLVGVALTLARPLPVVILGIATVTFGFFGGHSVASSWVGLRAREAKAQASALYLFWYYLGLSVAGTVGGVFWQHWQWRGVAGFVAALLVAALATAVVGLSDS